MGGGETPRLWGVSSKFCSLRVRTGSFCLFVRLSRSWVCCFACIVALLYGLIFLLPAGFLAWKGLFEVVWFAGSMRYVNQVNKQ